MSVTVENVENNRYGQSVKCVDVRRILRKFSIFISDTVMIRNTISAKVSFKVSYFCANIPVREASTFIISVRSSLQQMAN